MSLVFKNTDALQMLYEVLLANQRYEQKGGPAVDPRDMTKALDVLVQSIEKSMRKNEAVVIDFNEYRRRLRHA